MYHNPRRYGANKEVRLRARDRRMAAIHEAGHVVVAYHLGVLLSSAWISPVDDAGCDEMTWTGRVQMGLMNRSGTGRQRYSKRKGRMIAVAGAIAERSWKRELIEADDWFFADTMSETDWQMAGCDSGEPNRACFRAIEDVAGLLARDAPLWPALIREARDLILDLRDGCDRTFRTRNGA